VRTTAPDELVTRLGAEGVSVVAVTDHHLIDVDFIKAMRNAAGYSLTVLAGVELRTELGAREKVQIIGIFPEDEDLEYLWTKLQGLGIASKDVARKGNDSVWVPFEKACEAIHALGGFVTVHAGSKSNSIEANLPSTKVINRAIKTDLILKHVDAYEIGKVDDVRAYRETIFPRLGRSFPLVMCSDNHDARDLRSKTSMWVKADPGFRGLLQLKNEPESRIFLGDTPPSVTRVDQAATKYMTAISFERTAEAKDGEIWFSGDIALNPGLVAVIGNKGGGKSALADILALLGDSRASGYFPFLNRDQFLSPKSRLAGMFRAKVNWMSGHVVQRHLDQSVVQAAPELVKYIPQKYLETICSELRGSSDSQFDHELREVIYSHVGDADRLGKQTLPELIAYLTNETEERIGHLAGDLRSCNSVIVGLEDELTPEHRTTLQSQLDQRRAELKAHDEARPKAVEEPQQDPPTQEATAAVTRELAELQAEIARLEVDIAAQRVRDREETAKVASAGKLLLRIGNLGRQHDRFLAESVDDAKILGLDMADVVSLKIDRQPVLIANRQAEEARGSARSSFDAGTEGSLAARLATAVNDATERRQKLDEPGRRYQGYLQALKEWERKRAGIVGAAEMVNSEKELEARLAALDQLPHRIAEERLKRARLLGDIFAAKEDLLAKYRQLYAPVQEFIDGHPVAPEHRALQFEASIVVDTFIENLLENIHQGRKGSFQGENEGRERLRNLVSAADFGSATGALAFVEEVVDHLEHDRRDGGEKTLRLRDQLRLTATPQGVYDFLFGLQYLQPRFELRWAGKPLDQLSPGERGSLLLVFYLLIDKRDVPLIIDQPEENLDNQTITALLVPAIKAAKERRQIIIVTHNPNVAVVCDADQVIHARLQKTDGNRVTYTSGAIENPVITQLIVDVLEGTKPAFDLRDAKYEVLEREL
jgi:ABC-type lipoprotein export system ATPase subunit